MRFEVAQQVADAVLYEGYVLYPYRASSDKNRVRFQFGVVAPRRQAEPDGSEAWEMQTECLVRSTATSSIDVRVRFLQAQARSVERADSAAPGGFVAVASLEHDGEELVTWDEATEGSVDVEAVALADLPGGELVVPFSLPGDATVEPLNGPDAIPVGRIVRTRWPVEGRVILAAEAVADVVRLRVRIENTTPWMEPAAGREETLRRSLLGCHTLLGIRDGAFLSMTDPPPDMAEAAAASRNLHTWPVLVGSAGADDVVLSSPIILPDHPEIAPESPGDLFDATEIDEILTLRIMTLTDEEKRAARATDPRARRIIDRADAMPPEMLDKLHGAIRYLRGGPGTSTATDPFAPMRADPFGPRDGERAMPPSTWEPEARVAPELAVIDVGGVAVSKGSTVRLRPARRADAMDVFLAGRQATVEAVFESVDDETYVAVTIDDDPAADLHREVGRYYYFGPDEIEPVEAAREVAAS